MPRCLVFVVVSLCLWAEPGRDVRGTVTDASGAVVEGVQIRVAVAGRTSAAQATTGSDGRFQVSVPGVGSYLLIATKAGFARAQKPVEVRTAGELDVVEVRLAVEAPLSTVTVTAEANRVMDTFETTQPVTVVGRQTLEQSGPLLSEVITGQTGVHELRTSPTLGAVFARGLTGKNVAVYRDGVRYTNSAQRGGISTFLNLLQSDALETVEVLRGPNSAQYGSDSLGGTLSLLSREHNGPNGWHGDVAALYQSAANAAGPTASAGWGSDRYSLFSTLGALRSNTLRTGQGLDSHAAVTRFLGLPSNVMGTRLPDTAFTAYGGSLHATARPRTNQIWSAHYERSQQDGGKRYDQLLGGDGNWIADLRNLMLDFGYVRYQHLAAGPLDQVSLTGSFNAQREERVNQGGQGNPLGAITHQYEKTKVWGTQALAEKRLGRLEWLGGGDAYFEQLVAPSFAWNPVSNAVSLVRPRIPDGARYNLYGLFQQASWRPWNSGRLRLSGALRWGGADYRSRAAASPVVNGRPLWPNDSLSAQAWTGRVGAASWVTDWLALHAGYSRGFRAPNVTDLGTLGLQGNGLYEAAVADLSGRQAVIGTRADDLAVASGRAVAPLRPEFSKNFDAGVRVRRTSWQAEVTAFRMNLDDAILSQTLILPAGAVGQALGEQTITRQLASGAVFVPASTSPVLVRGNFTGAHVSGVEHSLRVKWRGGWSIAENFTYVRASDVTTGLPPDLEPGVPPATFNPVLSWRPAGRFWAEAYGTLAARQSRLSSLALSDRRIGNPRSRANIQSFFNNGARTRGLVANGLLVPTGETLAQVQNRVLGTLNSAPQFAAIPGFGVFGVRGGMRLGEATDLSVDVANLFDKNYRGIGWGVDGAGRGVQVRLRHRF